MNRSSSSGSITVTNGGGNFTVTTVGEYRDPTIVSGDCRRCGVRPATSLWAGHNDPGMALARNLTVPWCEQCCIEVQLEHARTVASHIPELEARLRVILTEG